MHNIAGGPIVKSELEQDSCQSDGGDHNNGKRAKKRSAVGVQHDQSQHAAKHAGGNNRAAARLTRVARDRFGCGIKFWQVASDETHCRHIRRWLRVPRNSPFDATLRSNVKRTSPRAFSFRFTKRSTPFSLLGYIFDQNQRPVPPG